MPVYPFTHNHRRHTIAIIDNKHRDDCAEFHDHGTPCPVKHDEPADDNQPARVVNDLVPRDVLLDAYEAGHDATPLGWLHPDQLAHIGSALNIRYALTAARYAADRLAALSPSERAEFDRRTSG